MNNNFCTFHYFYNLPVAIDTEQLYTHILTYLHIEEWLINRLEHNSVIPLILLYNPRAATIQKPYLSISMNHIEF